MVGWRKSPQIAGMRSPYTRWRAIRDICAILVFIAAGITWSVSCSVAAELSHSSEYELKAAFLFNFIKFTEWPRAELGKADDPIVIGIVGTDPFGPALDKTIQGEKVHDRAILVRRFPRMDAAATNSHVLFISASEATNLSAILKLLGGEAVLTVSDMDSFAERGGIINLKKESNKIVFEINLDAAKRAGLTMNAQLLKLAKIVKARS
jgi:hypothetical protein